MKIRIPNVDDKECYIEDKQSIVLLGANGAGKTRMSVWIDENNPELNIPTFRYCPTFLSGVALHAGKRYQSININKHENKTTTGGIDGSRCPDSLSMLGKQ